MKKRFLILTILVFLTAHLFAQEIVKGVVKTATGYPLPGVTVMIKNSKTVTITEVDDKYSVKVSPSDVLVFSGIELKKQKLNRTYLSNKNPV